MKNCQKNCSRNLGLRHSKIARQLLADSKGIWVEAEQKCSRATHICCKKRCFSSVYFLTFLQTMLVKYNAIVPHLFLQQ